MSIGHDLDIKEWENPFKYSSNFRESDIAKDTIAMAQKQWNGIDDAELAYQNHVQQVDANIASLRRKAAADTFGERLLEKTQKLQEGSTWLAQRRVPGQKAFEQELDKTAEIFGMNTLGKSQRTKRGKKFEEKAALQAEMATQMNGYILTREASLDYVLEHGRNYALGEDMLISMKDNAALDRYGFVGGIVTFFHQANSDQKLEENDRAGEMAKDMAMYSVAVGEEMSDDDRLLYMQKGSLELSDLFKNKSRFSFYNRVLDKLNDLDFTQFEYKTNESFAMGKGKKSFASRFATLRYYSHCVTMLEDMEAEKKKNPDFRLPDDFEALRIKAEFIKEILVDYENRALLIQSPFFALLAAKDFDGFSVQELEMRMERTSDTLAKQYLESVIKQKKSKGFGRGVSAKEVLKQRLAGQPLPEIPGYEEARYTEEARREAVENYEGQQPETYYTEDVLIDLAETKAKPRTITSELACRSLPFIVDKEAGEEECKVFKQRVYDLHRELNGTAAQTMTNRQGDAIMVPLFAEVDSTTYNALLEDQQVLENYRAKVAVLTDLADKSLPKDAAAINQYIEKLLDSDEYKETLSNMAEHVITLEKALLKWRSPEGQADRDKILKSHYLPGYFDQKSWSWKKK
ncbi:hypothetical protein [Butyrivibrio sp. AE2032]|uniref:hypothetical protein n=1 Tax=Butyrivibrio sp. AE2032 TaxID=1458463 RepID=UPI00054FAB8E|nr:hypothetical protein [Butyrivibrio sp. AE2032]